MATITKKKEVVDKMTKKEKGIYILKKYGYLMVFGLCALILVIALIASSGKKSGVPVFMLLETEQWWK